jgi:hypothetical protein
MGHCSNQADPFAASMTLNQATETNTSKAIHHVLHAVAEATPLPKQE